MIARRILFAAAVPLALLASGCGGGATNALQPRAAKVGDEVLTQDQLVDRIDLISAQPDGAETVGGSVAGTWSASALSQVVNSWVQEELLIQLGEAEGIEPTEEQLAAAQQQVVGDADVSKVPEEVIDKAVRAQAIRLVAAEQIAEEAGLFDFSEEAIQAVYEEQAPTLEQVCVSQIVILYDPEGTNATGVPTDEQLVSGQERADDVIARLEDGEAFADVAIAESDDPQTAPSGGDAGCFATSELQDPELAAQVEALDAGEFAPEPFEFEAGLLLFQVDSRDTPSLDDVRADIEAQLQQQASAEADGLVGQRIVEFADEIGVEIDPRYGTWDPDALTVAPPTGPVPPSTSTTALDPSQFGIDPSQLEGP